MGEEWKPGRMNRRRFLGHVAVAALGVPSVVTLLAACGDDEDETGTATPAAATAPPAEATATEGGEPSPTTAAEQATEPASGVEGGDFLMGQEFEPGQPGGILVEAAFAGGTNFGSYSARNCVPQRLTFESLIEPNPFTLEPVSLLAASWEASDDAVTWTFELRENVLWHDGEPFTADDVVFSYNYLLNEELNSPFYSTLEETIETVEAIDELTVVFTAKDVRVDFLYDAGLQLLAAEHVLSGIDPADYPASPAATGEDPALVVGTGPFRFTGVVPGDNYSAERFDAYWAGTPYLDGYVAREYQSGDAAMASLLAGDTDLSWEISLSYVTEIEDAGFTLNQWRAPGFDAIVLNLDPARTDLFQDVRVRQALLYGLDREAMILAAYNGVGEVANTIVTNGSVFANPEGVTVRYTYDPEQAMALLDEAGWVTGTDGVREKNGQRLAFSLATDAGWEPYAIQATVAQENWRLIGVEVELELSEYDVVLEAAASGDFEAVLYDYPVQLSPGRWNSFTCDNLNNYMGYCNPEVDIVFEEARVSTDQARRVELFTEFQNLILTDLPILPTIGVNGIMASAPRVRNPPRMELQHNMWWAAEKIWIEQ
jgi:peptide/nickel transport system substrate-binding protein